MVIIGRNKNHRHILDINQCYCDQYDTFETRKTAEHHLVWFVKTAPENVSKETKHIQCKQHAGCQQLYVVYYSFCRKGFSFFI